ncbi:calcium/proton exchanger [Polytolypa hystricis UAMH7299]|uniref:Calcium/proton exchanger n=1 Tax=Polytolypa hystricis (strain UAMH7299) TaxID=1447883 RepID=A0A2B7Y7A1_POLH7|nr:calcium/proton exchanger [Polytolypa hystricis UAMH7299]
MNEPPDSSPLSKRIRSWLRSGNTDGKDSLPLTNRLPVFSGLNPVCSNNDQTQDGTSHVKSEVRSGSAHITSAADPSTTSRPASPSHNENGDSAGEPEMKGPLGARIYNAAKLILLSRWINCLLVFVPLGIILGAINRSQGHNSSISPTVVFSINAVAIIPLASLLGFATENVASKLGDKIGALLNVTFGNAVELIIFIALVAKEVRIVQASILGSILSNLLLILGMCFLFGGLRFREQLYNPMITQMSASLLSLSVMSLLLPTAFHASFSNVEIADALVVKVSRGTSVILLLVYVLYLLFQLKSHAYIYESTPQHRIDEESHPGVLAGVLNSSPISESSTSRESSDTDVTSGSHRNANRFKKALRRRKHRKSSTTSRNPRTRATQATDPSSLGSRHPTDDVDIVASGDEADTDEARIARQSSAGQAGVVSRDFSKEDSTSKKKQKQKHEKRRHKKEDRPKPEDQDVAQANDPTVAADLAQDSMLDPPDIQAERRVEFAPQNDGAMEGQSRIPLNFSTISSNAVRPRMFSGRSFLSQAQDRPRAELPNSAAEPSRSRPVLRRTTSMPDRFPSPLPPPSIIRPFQPMPYIIPLIQAQNQSDDSDDPRAKQSLSRVSSVILLVVCTGLVAVCAEFLVESIDYLVESTGVSQVFIGLVILPIVGNAAEHITAVTVAGKNKMDLAIGIALGSSIQIAIFVTPLIVLLGWCLNTNMSLHFSLFETASLFVSTFIVSYLVLDGRTNYLEGALLISAYVMIAVAAFFYPSCENLSSASGPRDATNC